MLLEIIHEIIIELNPRSLSQAALSDSICNEIKDLGKKWCAFSKLGMEGLEILNRLREARDE